MGSLHLTAGSRGWGGRGGHLVNDVIIFYISLQTVELVQVHCPVYSWFVTKLQYTLHFIGGDLKMKSKVVGKIKWWQLSGIAQCLTRLSRWLVGLFVLFCFGNRRMSNIEHNILHCKYFWPFILFCFSWFSDWWHSKCSVRYLLC